VLIALQASSPDMRVAEAVLLRQLMVTFSAVKSAHRAVGGKPGRHVVEETTRVAVTVGARAAQERAEEKVRARGRAADQPRRGVLARVHHALYNPEKQRNLWTAQDIARSRITDDLSRRPEFTPRVDDPVRVRTVDLPVTAEQLRSLGALSTALQMDANMEAMRALTEAQAAATIRSMEFAVGAANMPAVQEMIAATPLPVAEWTAGAEGERLPLPNLGPDPVLASTVVTGAPIVTVDQAAAFEARLLRNVEPAVLASIEESIAAGGAGHDLDAYGARQETTLERLGYRDGDTVRVGPAGVPERAPERRSGVGEARATRKATVDWKSGLEPITPRQELALGRRGYTGEDLAGMPKGVASAHLDHDLNLADARAARGTYPPTRAFVGGGEAAPGEMAKVLKHARKQERGVS
jgi:hypothetical protein